MSGRVTKQISPPPVGKIIDLAYCLSLLFGSPVVSISLTYCPYYTALLHVLYRCTLLDYVIRILPSDSSS